MFNKLTLSIIVFSISGNLMAEDFGGLQGVQGQILILAILFAMFYFLIIRPQNKKNMEHKKLLDKLSKGDEILTRGGIIGKISKISENFVILEISNNVDIKIKKYVITKVLPKGTISSI